MWQLVFALRHRLIFKKKKKKVPKLLAIGCLMVKADPPDLGHGKNNLTPRLIVVIVTVVKVTVVMVTIVIVTVVVVTVIIVTEVTVVIVLVTYFSKKKNLDTSTTM